MAQTPGAKQPSNPDALQSIARLHVWQFQAVRDVLFVGSIIGLVWAGYALRAVTVPLLVALLLAYLFEPLVSWLTRRLKASRPMVVAGLIVTLGVVVVLSMALLVTMAVGQTSRLVDEIRAGRFQATVLRLKELVPESYRDDVQRAIQWIIPSAEEPIEHAEATTAPGAESPGEAKALNRDAVRQIVREELATERVEGTSVQPTSSLLRFVQRSSGAVFGILGTMITFGFLAFLIPFYFFFFSISFPSVVEFCRELIPHKNRANTMQLLGKMDRAIAGFVRGRIVIAALMGVMFAVGWWWCGVPYWMILGLVAGTFSLVPYLVAIGLPIAIGLLAAQQLGLSEAQRMSWWAIVLWPTVVYVIVQIIETYLLTPAIAGKATNLDPVTILVAVLAGGSIGGVYGMILAIPVAACGKILITDRLLPRIKRWVKGEAEDPLPLGPV